MVLRALASPGLPVRLGEVGRVTLNFLGLVINFGIDGRCL